MRPLMPPVQTPDNLFHDGNPLTGELGTIVDAEHLNNMQGAVRDAQSELITVLAAAGINVDPSKQNQLLTALKALLLSRSNPFADIKSDGTAAIATALSNLGLGTAALRVVGTGTNQIPDMSSFTSQKTFTGWQKLPGGLILQWGQSVSFGSEQNTLITFPVAFPGGMLMGYTTYANTTGDPAAGSTYIGQVRTTSSTQMYLRNLGPSVAQYNWFVIGY